MPRYPSLFQINTRVWLNHLSRMAGKRVTLADIDDATFDDFVEQGFHWIWLLSVSQTGAAGRAVSRGSDARHLVVVNYAGHQGQCRLPLPFPEFRGTQVHLTDLMGTEVYDRDGSEIVDPGLYIDHAPWQYNVFELRAI